MEQETHFDRKPAPAIEMTSFIHWEEYFRWFDSETITVSADVDVTVSIPATGVCHCTRIAHSASIFVIPILQQLEEDDELCGDGEMIIREIERIRK